MTHPEQTLSRELPRRRFLEGLGAGVVTGMASAAWPLEAATASAAWSMRLATSSVMFADLPIEQVCERVAKLELEAVDIWCPFGPCKHLDDVKERLGAQGLKHLLGQSRLKLCAFSVYGVGLGRYADLIKDFGGGVAVRESKYGKFEPGQLTQTLRSFFEDLKPQIELAGQCNAQLAIENHGNAILDSLDSIKAFTDLNPDPKRVGIALAPYHLQAGRTSVEEAVAQCGSQLLFFYAWQKADDLQQLPGHGSTDFTPWLKALARIGYSRHVTIFMHGHPSADDMERAVTRSRDYLKDCLGKGM